MEGWGHSAALEPRQDSGPMFLGTSLGQIWSPLGLLVTAPPSQPLPVVPLSPGCAVLCGTPPVRMCKTRDTAHGVSAGSVCRERLCANQYLRDLWSTLIFFRFYGPASLLLVPCGAIPGPGASRSLAFRALAWTHSPRPDAQYHQWP